MPRTRLTNGMRLALPETRQTYRIGPGMRRVLDFLARDSWSSRFGLAQAVASERGGSWRSAYFSIERLEEMGLIESVPYGPVELTEVGRRYVRRLLGTPSELRRDRFRVPQPSLEASHTLSAPRSPTATSSRAREVPAHLRCFQCGTGAHLERIIYPVQLERREARCRRCGAVVGW